MKRRDAHRVAGDDGDGEERKQDARRAEVGRRRRRGSFDPKYHLPTADEQVALRRGTTALFESKLEELATEELLTSVRVPEDALSDIEGCLFAVKAALEGGKERRLTADELPAGLSLTQAVAHPVSLLWQPPVAVDIVGSFLLRTLAPPWTVDVAVTMPAAGFEARDYSNARYADKRKLYLAGMADVLAGCEEVADISFGGFAGDASKPVLVITPADAAARAFTIRLLPAIEEGVFKRSALLPRRNNFKRRTHAGAAQIATPHYTHAIVEDTSFHRSLAYLHERLTAAPGLLGAVLLGKTWLHVRRIGAPDSLTGFTLSMLLAHLLDSRRINRHMGSLQMFRVLMLVLTDIGKSPIVMAGCSADEETVATFSAGFDAVFLDASGLLNLFGRLSHSALLELRHEASKSLAYLASRSMDSFAALFTNKQPFKLRFDSFLSVDVPPLPDSEQLSLPVQNALCDRAWQPFLMRHLTGLLAAALRDRLLLCRPEPQASPLWQLHDAPPQRRRLLFGLLLHGDNYRRIVDRAPLDKAAAKSFKALWGKLAELRQFKDGALVEAVVWKLPAGSEHRIPAMAVHYIWQRHCPFLDLTSFHAVDAQLDAAIADDDEATDLYRLQSTTQLRKALDELVLKLKAVPAVPLTIKEVLPISQHFRYTSPRPAMFEDAPELQASVEALDVHLKLEASSRWPLGLAAMRAAKTAFYIQYARGLKNKWDINCAVTRDSMTVFSGGFFFRFHIVHEPERLALRKARLSAELQQWELAFKQRAAHASAVAALQSRYPMFGQLVRLTQAWLDAQLLTSHLAPELVELLVAHLFCHPQPYSPPLSLPAGLLRLFQLLANHDWRRFPLVVNFASAVDDDDDDADAEDGMQLGGHQKSKKKNKAGKSRKAAAAAAGAALQRKAEAAFDKAASAACWIVSSATPTPVWASPSHAILHRLQRLAAAGLKRLLGLLSDNYAGGRQWKKLFKSDMASCSDLIIHCKSDALLRPTAIDEPPAKRLKALKGVALPMIAFDPLQRFVTQLRTRLGDAAVLFYDPHNGRRIGVALHPKLFTPRPFSVAAAGYALPVGDDLLLNLPELVEDIVELGRGLVRKVEVL